MFVRGIYDPDLRLETAWGGGRGAYYLRWLLVAGSLSVIRYAQRHGTKRPWLVKLLERRTSKIAAVALANTTARMAWALMNKGEKYREPPLQAA